MLDIFIVILGLVFGSFIAAYSYRYPRGIKISKGFSFCDKCGRNIEWYENIPAFSYMFLGGKCKSCKKKISPRYPIIEFVTSAVFLLTFKGQALQDVDSILTIWNLVYVAILFVLLEMIFIIDLEHQIIPDDFVFFGVLISFINLLFFNQGNLFSVVLSGLIASAFLLLVYLLTLGRGMGLGDVKFAVFGGMLVGLSNLFIWMLLAFLTGAITGIILILIGNAKLKDKIAFGPFLIISIPIALIFGQNILKFIGLTF